MFNSNFKSLLDLVRAFPTEEKCMEYLEWMRWEGETPISPFDAESKVYKCKGFKYKCKNTGKYFNARTGTMMDNTKIELVKWLMAVWLVTCHKKGISSCQLARDLDVTQKTAWFLLQRIRACFGIENYNELEGTVEADESFYGGKNKNRHNDKKAPKCRGRAFVDKVPIVGLIQRGGKMTAIVTKDTTKGTLHKIVKTYVKEDSVFIADDWDGYNGLDKFYDHRIVKNTQNNYVNLYDPNTHTNNIEGAWKIMKNSLRDNYNHVSRKHIQWYVDEFVYRYNMRQHPESDKFNWLVTNSDVRTKYKELVA